MGMFDDVIMVVKCPRCGDKVDGFQSKDCPCCLGTLKFWEVDSFYSTCEKCGCSIYFTIKNSVRKELAISAYEMVSYEGFEPYKGYVGEIKHNPEEFIIKEEKA